MLPKYRFQFCKELIINIAGGDKGSQTRQFWHFTNPPQTGENRVKSTHYQSFRYHLMINVI